MRTIAITLLALVYSFTLAACRVNAPATSSAKVDSGFFITAKSKNTVPAVMAAFTGVGDKMGMCTATAVSDNTILLAAHCIGDGVRPDATDRVSNVKLCVQGPAVLPKDLCTSEIYLPSEYYSNGYMTEKGFMPDFSRDVAFAVFTGSPFKNIALIASTPAATNDPFLMVGYSQQNALKSELQENGSKRWGSNVIESLKKGQASDALPVIYSTYGGQQSQAALSPGDSGGPLFIGCRVAGVASRLAESKDAYGNILSPKMSLHTDVSNPKNLQWLASKRATSKAEFCGVSGADASRCNGLSALQNDPQPASQEFPCKSGNDDSSGGQGLNKVTLAILDGSNGASIKVATPSTYQDVKIYQSKQEASLDKALNIEKLSQGNSQTAFYRIINGDVLGERNMTYIIVQAKTAEGKESITSFKLTPR